MRPASLHPAAQAELRNATLWYGKRSVQTAGQFVEAIDHAMQQIADDPARFPTTRSGARRFVLLQFPFSVIYRVHAQEIEIVAVAHHTRRPGYWRNR